MQTERKGLGEQNKAHPKLGLPFNYAVTLANKFPLGELRQCGLDFQWLENKESYPT